MGSLCRIIAACWRRGIGLLEPPTSAVRVPARPLRVPRKTEPVQRATVALHSRYVSIQGAHMSKVSSAKPARVPSPMKRSPLPTPKGVCDESYLDTPDEEEASTTPRRGMPDPAPISLSPAGAARYLGLSRRQVSRLISSGALQARRAGSRTLVSARSCRMYLANLPPVTGPRGVGRNAR